MRVREGDSESGRLKENLSRFRITYRKREGEEKEREGDRERERGCESEKNKID